MFYVIRGGALGRNRVGGPKIDGATRAKAHQILSVQSAFFVIMRFSLVLQLLFVLGLVVVDEVTNPFESLTVWNSQPRRLRPN